MLDSFTFDAADRLTAISDKAGKTTLFAASYTRDNANQLTSDSSIPSSIGSYQYNTLNQLCYAASSTRNACSSPPRICVSINRRGGVRLKPLLDFLRELENHKIHYALLHARERAIMVIVTVPGQRWEVEFFEDGRVDVEKFLSDGTISGESELRRLFEEFGG